MTLTDNELLEKSVYLRALADAATDRFRQTLVISISLPPQQPATITALRGAATLGAWTVQADEVLETVAAVLEGEVR
jgi:hypothetical protein